jgi:hypothetical protein
MYGTKYTDLYFSLLPIGFFWCFFCPVPEYFSSFEIQKLIESNLNPQNLPVQFAQFKFLFLLRVVFTSTILFLRHAFDFLFVVCIGIPIISLLLL